MGTAVRAGPTADDILLAARNLHQPVTVTCGAGLGSHLRVNVRDQDAAVLRLPTNLRNLTRFQIWSLLRVSGGWKRMWMWEFGWEGRGGGQGISLVHYLTTTIYCCSLDLLQQSVHEPTGVRVGG